MAQKIYVGNLNYATTEEGLTNLFGTYGEVVSAVVIKDKFSNRSKGFGFVEMADEGAAQNAIAELNEKEFEGSRLYRDYGVEHSNTFYIVTIYDLSISKNLSF